MTSSAILHKTTCRMIFHVTLEPIGTWHVLGVGELLVVLNVPEQMFEQLHDAKKPPTRKGIRVLSPRLGLGWIDSTTLGDIERISST